MLKLLYKFEKFLSNKSDFPVNKNSENLIRSNRVSLKQKNQILVVCIGIFLTLRDHITFTPGNEHVIHTLDEILVFNKSYYHQEMLENT